MSIENEIIGFVIGFTETILVGLIIYYFWFVRKKKYNYLLEFNDEELRG